MFPNDDICNVKAAKDAAKNIFNKYKQPSQTQSDSSGLGQKQVSDLIKNAYKAINISYDPDKSDVSSFMSVFGVGQDGKIDLGKIQQMAVKYLCGQQTLDYPQKTQQSPNNKQPINNHFQVNSKKYTKLSSEQILSKSYQIFHLNKNSQAKGITVKEAPKILTLTYQMMGKQNYNPKSEDVQLWMKLCDSKKVGYVDRANYQNFVKKLIERQNINSKS